MLQVDFIKENFSKVISSLKKRNKDYSTDLKRIIDYNENRKKHEQNTR
jgi:seryl-tRNA synthetase